jgi:hypothetical protein
MLPPPCYFGRHGRTSLAMEKCIIPDLVGRLGGARRAIPAEPERRTGGSPPAGWHGRPACPERRPAARNGGARPKIFEQLSSWSSSAPFRWASGPTERASCPSHPSHFGIRVKPEFRFLTPRNPIGIPNPKSVAENFGQDSSSLSRATEQLLSAFGFRASDLFRHSAFGIRILCRVPFASECHCPSGHVFRHPTTS